MATYTVTITDADETALNNDLLDIDTWIQDAVTGKINNCKKRMIEQWRPIVFADDSVATIPANDDDVSYTWDESITNWVERVEVE